MATIQLTHIAQYSNPELAIGSFCAKIGMLLNTKNPGQVIFCVGIHKNVQRKGTTLPSITNPGEEEEDPSRNRTTGSAKLRLTKQTSSSSTQQSGDSCRNQHIKGPKLTISEFYKWLGCQFFMACYEGISDRTPWWSSKKVDMFDGTSLNEYMSAPLEAIITA
ncbi:hypothetical protein ACHAWO_002137 [Cyclotella atomus]|uniref:Uncharacterized protein n=1 Tax=Cyclotella atomus TaxID=382360 RepID=A0ABD3QQK2_9STRA